MTPVLLQRVLAAWRAVTQGSPGLNTPAVTKAQQLALGQAIVVVLIVLGFNLDSSTEQLLIGLSATIAAGLPVSDAAIRRARAQNATAVASAQASTATATTATTATTAATTTTTTTPQLDDAQRQELLDALRRLRA